MSWVDSGTCMDTSDSWHSCLVRDAGEGLMVITHHLAGMDTATIMDPWQKLSGEPAQTPGKSTPAEGRKLVTHYGSLKVVACAWPAVRGSPGMGWARTGPPDRCNWTE